LFIAISTPSPLKRLLVLTLRSHLNTAKSLKPSSEELILLDNHVLVNTYMFKLEEGILAFKKFNLVLKPLKF